MIRTWVAGVLAAVVLGLGARSIGDLTGWLPAAPAALLGGMLLSALPRWRPIVAPGAERVAGRILRAGVAMLGAGLNVGAVIDHGVAAISAIIAGIAAVLMVSWTAGGRLGLPANLRLLVGAGLAICGNSAIAAVAPVIRAERAHVATAVAVVTVTGTLAVLLYPLLGALLGLHPMQYGVWVGLGVADTGQVLAAALPFGTDATDVATITKLTRNAFLGPVVILIALMSRSSVPGNGPRLRLFVVLPPFVIGFVSLAALRSAGVLSAGAADALAAVAGLLLLIGLAAVGLATDLGGLMRSGGRAVVAGLALAATVGAVALGASALVTR